MVPSIAVTLREGSLALAFFGRMRKVQESAFAQLEKPAKQSFDYKPGLSAAERKAVVAKWKSWATDHCGPLEGPAARKS